MSGTPEYYFKKRWVGLENLAKVIGGKNSSSKRNSVELSIGEHLQDLAQIVETILASRSELRDALIEKSLSENALHPEVRILEALIEPAVTALNEGEAEIARMKSGLLLNLANHQSYDQKSA